jgi:hypothetical protein
LQAGVATLVLNIIYKALASAATDLAEDITTAANGGTAEFCAEFAAVCNVVAVTTTRATQPGVTPVDPPTPTPPSSPTPNPPTPSPSPVVPAKLPLFSWIKGVLNGGCSGRRPCRADVRACVMPVG